MASSDRRKDEEIHSSIKELKRDVDELVLEDAAKGAVVVIDKGGEIKLASAFPRTEKLVFANVGFESSDGNLYFEYERDEVDEKQVKQVEDEIKPLSGKDLMIKEMIDDCKYDNVTKSAIHVLKSRVSTLPPEQFDELVKIISKEKNEEKNEDDEGHED